MPDPPAGTRRLLLVIGFNQLLSWSTTFYLPAVVAGPAAASLGVPRIAVVGGFSWSLLIAGACAPRIGRWIDRHGGREVLAAGSVIMAAGLAVLAGSPVLAAWYGGWTVLGIGMALGLYDAAFATVGCLLGRAAGPVITGVTLMGGFASSIGWPAGTAIAAALGWRNLLLIYAALQLAVNLPLVLLLVPRGGAAAVNPAMAPHPAEAGRVRRQALACLSGFFTLRWLITSMIAVYVLRLFQGVGLSLAQAVFVAALIGPGQVAGRLLEWSVGRRIGLLASARIGALLFPAGALLLLLGGPFAAGAFAVLYGMSNGILTINRGTLPMAIFGPEGYAALLGWLAVPVLLAQAVSPTLTAPLVAALPAREVLLLAGGVAGIAVLLLLPLRVDAAPLSRS